MTKVALSVRSLEVAYGPMEVVHGISFEVPDGGKVALIGANGAGKTTTLRAVTGLLRCSGGSVVLRDVEITNCRAHRLARSGIAMVPEGRGILRTMTVRENLLLAASLQHDRNAQRRAIESVLDRLPLLAERLDSVAGDLSGGQQQILAIGRAMATGSTVLLLDEPSLGLSPIAADDVFELLGDLCRNGVSILLVEQNAYRAMSFADYVHVIESGEIRLHGKPSDLGNLEGVQSAYLGDL